MAKTFASVAVLVGFYGIAWLAAFFSVVGFEPALIPSYFTLGWSFAGLELASMVWLLAWPIFVATLVAYHFVWRRRQAGPASQPN